MAKKFYDYETETGDKLTLPRMHFRNMAGIGSFMGFNLESEEINNLYNHPYDIYSDPNTGSFIYVMGSDAHCHEGKELGIHEEAIALYCEEKDKESLLKSVRSVR